MIRPRQYRIPVVLRGTVIGTLAIYPEKWAHAASKEEVIQVAVARHPGVDRTNIGELQAHFTSQVAHLLKGLARRRISKVVRDLVVGDTVANSWTDKKVWRVLERGPIPVARVALARPRVTMFVADVAERDNRNERRRLNRAAIRIIGSRRTAGAPRKRRLPQLSESIEQRVALCAVKLHEMVRAAWKAVDKSTHGAEERLKTALAECLVRAGPQLEKPERDRYVEMLMKRHKPSFEVCDQITAAVWRPVGLTAAHIRRIRRTHHRQRFRN